MNIIKDTISNEIEIKKSKFITSCMYVETEEQINKYLNDIRKKYYDARHNCYAYTLGIKNITMKQSDDNEPKGTAGLPILNALKLKDMTNCLIVVTRYFGGILLGATNLFRAYSDSANIVLDTAVKSNINVGTKYKLIVDYKEYNKIEKYIFSNRLNVTIVDTKYLEYIMIIILVKDSFNNEFISNINTMFNGKMNMQDNEQVYYSIFNNEIRYLNNI